MTPHPQAPDRTPASVVAVPYGYAVMAALPRGVDEQSARLGEFQRLGCRTDWRAECAGSPGSM
ncbi:hypothetical protein OCAE111667_22925 [Occultella aeris]|uniref:Uncharacterized protein n=1 Tax=Occultella aeris TaxID=2761496 RepID=A0A7M4DLE3_9MICO|nr:hypothetical protein HALOF300_02960 [Occultella aeris]